ncbi:hypothetical protein AK812_SmicGene46566, partial [Symbiodinium microadriaticum]
MKGNGFCWCQGWEWSDSEPFCPTQGFQYLDRSEIEGAVSGLTDRVAALEGSLQAHNNCTFQAVETLSAGQAEQALQIHQLAPDSKTTLLEGTVKNLQSAGSTPSTMDAGTAWFKDQKCGTSSGRAFLTCWDVFR